MPLRCRLGLHKWWPYIGTNFSNDPPRKSCLRCPATRRITEEQQ